MLDLSQQWWTIRKEKEPPILYADTHYRKSHSLEHFMFLFCLVCMYMCGCMHVSAHTRVRKLGGGSFSFLRVDARDWTQSSGLVASVISHWAISPAHRDIFIGLYWEATHKALWKGFKLCPLDVAGRDQGFYTHSANASPGQQLSPALGQMFLRKYRLHT